MANNNNRNLEDAISLERRNMLGANLSFAVKEAYKQLRTNLDFSLSNVEGCKVIGVTSANRSDGKSLTSINLSNALAETGKNVLLIEGDMRLPSLSRKLMLNKAIGLSNVLAGQENINDAIVSYSTKPEDTAVVPFYILTAGSIPPNPSELLGSEQMQHMLDSLKKSFQYVVIDLPPVEAVSDALAVSKFLDGMIVMCRPGHTLKGELEDTIHQLEFSHVRILGFVLNGVGENNRSYKYHYKSRYRSGRYGGYGYGSYGYGSYGNYGYGGYQGNGYYGSKSGNNSANQKGNGSKPQ